MQRQLVVLVAAHPSVQRPGLSRHDTTDFIRQVHRDRGKHVVSRASTDEKIHDGPMRIVVGAIPTGRPADDLELVVVTVPDDVAARVRQTPDHREVPSCSRPVHRGRVVALLTHVHVESALKNHVYHRETLGRRTRILAGRCQMQQGVLVWLVANVQLLRVLVEQLRQRANVPPFRGVEQLAVHCQRIDVCLERPPAGETILLGEVELGVGQFGGRSRLAQLVEPAFGLFAEPVEIGGVRE